MLGHGIHKKVDFLMFFSFSWPPACIHMHHTFPVFHRFHLSGFTFFRFQGIILGYFTHFHLPHWSSWQSICLTCKRSPVQYLQKSIFGISNFHVLFIISMHLDGYIHKYGLEFHQPLWFSGSVLSQLSSWSRVQFLPSQNAVRGPLGISWIAGWLVQSEEAKALVGGEARMTVWLSSGLHHHVICLETLRKIRFWFSWPASRQI